MKKLLFVSVMMMAVMVVNAQRTTIKVTDLQKPITEYITKDFAGFVIKDATKVVASNAVTYEVGISKGSTSETLVFDKDGKFLHKLTVKSGSAEKSGTTPAATKPVQKKN